MIAYIKPSKIKIYVNTQRKSMAQVKSETGCTHIINGGIYNMSSFVPYCHLKVDGKILAKDQYTYWGYGSDGKTLTLSNDINAYDNYISCVNMVRDGKAQTMYVNSELQGRRGRTAIGLMPDGRVILYCAPDGSEAKTPEELQAYFVSLGAESAIMLDGGGSAQCDFDGQAITSDRIVHNFICLWDEPENKGGDDIEIRQSILTKNDCYKAGRTINPTGIMVHSTGANNPSLSRFLPGDELIGYNKYNNHWDMPSVNVCVHALIGKDKNGNVRIYQTLPWNMRGWHAGGSANDTHIGFEICEDGLTDPVYFNAVYNAAVNLCVHLCKTQGISPDNIVCHSEGYKLGIASNHADVMHWFPKHGKTMDDFRKAVKDKLSTSAPAALTQEQFNAMLKIGLKQLLGI